MLKRTFNPQIAYRAAVYVRMSSDKQNKRSPDQQIAEVQKRLKDMGLEWLIVKVYRDDAISGRFLRKRVAYQAMLRDIKSGVLSVDLILVDTIERFGRVDELATIRKELYEKHGILVLSGDTNFCDPLTPQGKAMGMFEAMRVTEDGRIKAHNVIRGKRDIASRKFWPGGPPPFGYRLRSITTSRDGKLEIQGSVLEPEPEEARIIALTFRKARETDYGATRLTHFLNANMEIPEKLKPFHPATVGRWLKNQIYKGVLIWGANCTGIVDDTRVLKRTVKRTSLSSPIFARVWSLTKSGLRSTP